MTAATKKSKPLDHTTDQKYRDKVDTADRKTDAKPSSIKVVRIRIADVTIPDDWRHIDEKS